MNDSTRATRDRGILVAQLLVIAALTAILVPMIPVGMAIAGGVGIKLLWLSRLPFVLVIATWFLRLRGLGWRDLGLAWTGWRPFLKATLVGLVVPFSVSLIYSAIAHVAHLGRPDDSFFHALHGNLGLYLFMAIPGAWGTAAFCEEMIFRGFLLDGIERLFLDFLHRRAAMWGAVILQAVFFGAMHFYQGAGGIITTGLMGFGFGLVWIIARRNLWPGIVLHGLVDFSSFTALFLAAPG